MPDTTLGWFPLRIPQDGNGQESFLCLVSSRSELTGSNTKETFLSVPVLRKVFLSGNQPFTGLLSGSGTSLVKNHNIQSCGLLAHDCLYIHPFFNSYINFTMDQILHQWSLFDFHNLWVRTNCYLYTIASFIFMVYIYSCSITNLFSILFMPKGFNYMIL